MGHHLFFLSTVAVAADNRITCTPECTQTEVCLKGACIDSLHLYSTTSRTASASTSTKNSGVADTNPVTRQRRYTDSSIRPARNHYTSKGSTTTSKVVYMCQDNKSTTELQPALVPPEPALKNMKMPSTSFKKFMNVLKRYSDITKNEFDAQTFYRGLKNKDSKAESRLKKMNKTQTLMMGLKDSNFQGFRRPEHIIQILQKINPNVHHTYINDFLFKYYSKDKNAKAMIKKFIDMEKATKEPSTMINKIKHISEPMKTNREDLMKFLKNYQKVTRNRFNIDEFLNMYDSDKESLKKMLHQMMKTYNQIRKLSRKRFRGLRPPKVVVEIIRAAKRKSAISVEFVNTFLLRYYKKDRRYRLKLESLRRIARRRSGKRRHNRKKNKKNHRKSKNIPRTPAESPE